MKSETNGAIYRRLSALLKDSNDAITVQDLKGNILDWKSALSTIQIPVTPDSR